jgi:hypothetical protein
MMTCGPLLIAPSFLNSMINTGKLSNRLVAY